MALDPLVASGLIQGAASLFGNIFGANASSSSVSSSNATNLQIAEMNNAAAMEQIEAMNAFNLDMWNLNNEYNSPLQQRQRLLEAGINPLSSSISNSPSTPVSQSQIAPRMSFASIPNDTGSYLKDSLTGFGEAASTYFENKHKVSLTKTEDALRDYRVNLMGVEYSLKDFELKNLKPLEVRELSARIDTLNATYDKIYNDINVSLSTLSIDQQRLFLEQAAQDFDQWIQREQLSQQERRIAIEMFVATTNAKKVFSDIELNNAQYENIREDTMGKRIANASSNVDLGTKLDNKELYQRNLVSQWCNEYSSNTLQNYINSQSLSTRNGSKLNSAIDNKILAPIERVADVISRIFLPLAKTIK